MPKKVQKVQNIWGFGGTQKLQFFCFEVLTFLLTFNWKGHKKSENLKTFKSQKNKKIHLLFLKIQNFIPLAETAKKMKLHFSWIFGFLSKIKRKIKLQTFSEIYNLYSLGQTGQKFWHFMFLRSSWQLFLKLKGFLFRILIFYFAFFNEIWRSSWIQRKKHNFVCDLKCFAFVPKTKYWYFRFFWNLMFLKFKIKENMILYFLKFQNCGLWAKKEKNKHIFLKFWSFPIKKT